MSEYQYYEWQALERPLTATEQAAVNGLSSHIDVTSSQAIVTYEWGDFKHDPIAVLAKYFDAHLYITNWGTRHLAFRFPKGVLDTKAIEVYCDEDHIRLKTLGQVQIFPIRVNQENCHFASLGDCQSGLAGLLERVLLAEVEHDFMSSLID